LAEVERDVDWVFDVRRDAKFLEWEDDFRREVLAAPLTSFIMPALTVPAMQTERDT